MKTIVNRTHRPLKIQLHGGKVLHLGPAKTGQISDEAASEPAIKRRIQAGEIEIQGESAHTPDGAASQGGVGEATHGHPQTTVVLPKGNR